MRLKVDVFSAYLKGIETDDHISQSTLHLTVFSVPKRN